MQTLSIRLCFRFGVSVQTLPIKASSLGEFGTSEQISANLRVDSGPRNRSQRLSGWTRDLGVGPQGRPQCLRVDSGPKNRSQYLQCGPGTSEQKSAIPRVDLGPRNRSQQISG